MLWVDLARLDFSEGAPVKMLDLGVGMNRMLADEVSGQFAPSLSPSNRWNDADGAAE